MSCFFFVAVCKRASYLGGSCNIECCEGDLCNQASPIKEENTTAYNVTESEGIYTKLNSFSG